MLYIFNVLSGSMFTLEMDLALQKVEKLKEAIQRETKTPVEKQVLLISGGVALESQQDVGHYNAGTDASPIFFFSMENIVKDMLPLAQLDNSQVADIKDKIEESKNLPAIHSTVAARANLTKTVSESSQDIYCRCKKVVYNQYLQQQGWSVAVANLEDISVALTRQFTTFERSFKEHMNLRERRLNLIDNFKEDLKLLQKIPLLPALSSSSSCNIGYVSDNLLPVGDMSSPVHSEKQLSSTIKQKSLTLLDWILPKGFQDSEEPLQDYRVRLTKLDHSLKEELSAQYNDICSDISKKDVKEIGGLGARLSHLDDLLRDGEKIVEVQKDYADSFSQNLKRSVSCKDASIYVTLCKSQVTQLENMLYQYEKIRDILKRSVKARDELSHNIKTRLRWILFVEQKVNTLNSHLLLWIENMKKIDSQLSIYEQVHTCPKLYFEAVVEVIRRQNFCQNFSRWAVQLSTENRCIWEEEVASRESFMERISSHFLKDLFPGLNDIPPAFATESPETFDQGLPKLTPDNILLLKELVPEICSEVSFNKLFGIPQILLHPYSPILLNEGNENISSEKRVKNSTESFTSTVGSTTAHKATSTEMRSDLPLSPDHVIVSRPSSLIRDHPESETDTEEFEKVCGSISDGTYSPMEPEKNMPVIKMKSRSLQETNPPLSDRLQSPPSQLLHEFVNVQCKIPEEGEPPHNLLFENLTQNDLIDALQTEANHLKKDNLSQDDLKAIISRLCLVISKLNDVKMVSITTGTLKEAHDEIDLKNNQLNDAHREIEIYQNEIQRLQASIQQMGIDFDEERRHIKIEHEDVIRQLSLEHELEIEAVQRQVEGRSDKLGILKNKLSEIEMTLHNTEKEKLSLTTKINEMESVYREREREAIGKEQRKLLEEHIRDKQRLEDSYKKSLESSLTDLRVQLEREFSERSEKEKQELEIESKKELLKCSELWEAQKELVAIQKSKEEREELVSKYETEREAAKLQHKMELECLRSRFKMVTMDRSPSETSLEKVERGDFIEASVHELALMKIREEFNKEKEVALTELRKCLEESYKTTIKDEIQKLEENRKKIEAEKQEEFNNAINSITLDKERVIENLRLKVEFLTEENEKYLKHASPSKLSEDQGQQQHSCEAHKKEIDRLEKEVHKLRRLSFISERHSDVSLSFTETGTVQVTPSSALEQPIASAASYAEGMKRLQQENSELNQAFLRYRSERPPKIAMFSCQPYDNVLLIWDPAYSQYRILLEGQSSLHFVHSESYVSLGLSKEKPISKMFCLAEVVRKEFCQAKKDGNRFGVSKGTKFYRVICRPFKELTPLAETESRQRKSSVVGPPPGLYTLSTISLPSNASEGEFSIPTSDAEAGFFSASAEFLDSKEVSSEQKPESTSVTPEKRSHDST